MIGIIEAFVREYIMQKDLPGIGANVYLERPEEAPDRYILIEKTGSGREELLDSAVLAVQSLSRNRMYEAAETNERVKAALLAMPEETEVFSCELNTDYNYTNTETKEYRYQAVFQIDYRIR